MRYCQNNTKILEYKLKRHYGSSDILHRLLSPSPHILMNYELQLINSYLWITIKDISGSFSQPLSLFTSEQQEYFKEIGLFDFEDIYLFKL